MTLSEEWRMIEIDGWCCQPEPKVKADNTLRHLHKSLRLIKIEFSNCFVIHFKYFLMYNIVISIKMARSLFSLQLAYFSVFFVVFFSIFFFEYFSYLVFPFLNSSCNLVAKKGCKTALFLNWPYEVWIFQRYFAPCSEQFWKKRTLFCSPVIIALYALPKLQPLFWGFSFASFKRGDGNALEIIMLNLWRHTFHATHCD